MNYTQKLPKQQSGQGCLPICLAYLYGLPATRQFEATILQAGQFGQRDSYSLGICQAFMKNYPRFGQIRLITGNKYYQSQLLARNDQKSLMIEFQPMNDRWLANLPIPCIVAVDRWALGSYIHAPHYVVLTAKTKQSFWVFDPWYGTVTRRQCTTIMKGMKMVQKHLKMAPICIQSLSNIQKTQQPFMYSK